MCQIVNTSNIDKGGNIDSQIHMFHALSNAWVTLAYENINSFISHA